MPLSPPPLLLLLLLCSWVSWSLLFTPSNVVVVSSGVPCSLVPSFCMRSIASFTIGYIAMTAAIWSADIAIASGPWSCFQ